MANRHVPGSGACPICNQAAEDVIHLLFQCPTAKELWRLLNLQGLIEETIEVEMSGSTVLEQLLRKDDNSLPGFDSIQLKELIAVTCWYLWWIRRRRTHGEDVPPLAKCKLSILSITANSAQALKKKGAGVDSHWTRPPPRKVKLNVDASFVDGLHAGATGAILRDYEGKFVAASCSYLPFVASVAVAEARAMKEGLLLANRLGVSVVIAESDSLETVEACTGAETWWNESAAILADCVDIVAEIGTVSFAHCPREANRVADSLAKHCFSSKISCNWVDEPPDFLLDPLLYDVTMVDG